MADLVLSGIVGVDITAAQVRKYLATNKAEHINVFISSPGGYVEDGMEIYNTLRASGRDITTINMGMCASMGSIIFLAGDERISMAGSTYMVHKPSNIALGNADDMRKIAEDLDRCQDRLEEVYNDRLSIENISEMINNETWLNKSEMAELGISNSNREVIMTFEDEEKEGEYDMTREELEKALAAEKAKNAALEEEKSAKAMEAELAELQAKNEALEKENEAQEVEENDEEPEPTPEGEGDEEDKDAVIADLQRQLAEKEDKAPTNIVKTVVEKKSNGVPMAFESASRGMY